MTNSYKLGQHIIFIGPYSKTPEGGVAFVLSEYRKIFPDAYFVASTISKNKLTKIIGFTWGLLHFAFLLIAHPEIKIIHIHGASYTSFKRKYIFYKLARLWDKKVIYHIHGGAFHKFYESANESLKRKIIFMLNDVDCVVCLSEKWQKFFASEFNPRLLKVIPNIIPVPFVKLSTDNIKKTLTFLFLGLIDTNKGIWFLMETLRNYKTEIEGKAEFYIGGNGETKKLQNLIHEYHLENLVKYIGWVSGEEKQRQLNEADIYLLPSFNEGLPISILEAMSYSMPVLSTTVGGIPEIVDNSNGILIEPGNEEQLWQAIEFFINAEDIILKKMGQLSMEKAKSHIPTAVYEKLNILYNSL